MYTLKNAKNIKGKPGDEILIFSRKGSSVPVKGGPDE